MAPKTAKDAVNGIGASLSIMKKDLGEIVAKAFLTYIVTELVESFNVGKTMNDIQVVFAVNGIQEDYFYLKPEELKYIFNKAKKGGYGTMYDRIDAAVIFGWIEEFLIERTQICIDKNVESNKTHKKAEPIHESVLKFLNNKVIKEVPPVNMELITPEPRKRTEEEEIIQDIFKEFDNLYEYDPKERIRTVIYNGKKYNQDKFLTLRLEELNKL